jgi:hypothetical protein
MAIGRLASQLKTGSIWSLSFPHCYIDSEAPTHLQVGRSAALRPWAKIPRPASRFHGDPPRLSFANPMLLSLSSSALVHLTLDPTPEAHETMMSIVPPSSYRPHPRPLPTRLDASTDVEADATPNEPHLVLDDMMMTGIATSFDDHIIITSSPRQGRHRDDA